MWSVNWAHHSETVKQYNRRDSLFQYAAIKGINEPNSRDFTLLILAIMNGHVPVAELLLDKVLDLDLDQGD